MGPFSLKRNGSCSQELLHLHLTANFDTDSEPWLLFPVLCSLQALLRVPNDLQLCLVLSLCSNQFPLCWNPKLGSEGTTAKLVDNHSPSCWSIFCDYFGNSSLWRLVSSRPEFFLARPIIIHRAPQSEQPVLFLFGGYADAPLIKAYNNFHSVLRASKEGTKSSNYHFSDSSFTS